MADARSPSYRPAPQAHHAAEMQGYANALKVAYRVEELPPKIRKLLDDLDQREPKTTS